MYSYSAENSSEIAQFIQDFCRKDIGSHTSHLKMFNFIDDEELKTIIAKEFYIARYIYKLQMALKLTKESFELFGLLKMQIVQYGGLFEAVIHYLLTKKYSDHDAVKQLTQVNDIYKKVDALSNGVSVKDKDGTELFLCRKTKASDKRWESINFEDKLKAAVTIGLISNEIKAALLETYNLRNYVHIQKHTEKEEIEFEIKHCRDAFQTFLKFLKEIRTFLQYSETPDIQKEEETIKSEFEESLTSVSQDNQNNSVQFLVPGLVY